MRAVNLRTEYLVDPLAVQTRHPRLMWQVEDGRFGAKQTAYEVRVKAGGETVWETGKVAPSNQTETEYNGPPLASKTDCEWQVRVWDADGKASPWSTAEFRTGLYEKSDWDSLWITTPDAVPEIRLAHNGYHSELETTPEKTKWVTLDLGSRKSLDTVRLWPANPIDWSPRTPGFLFPLQFRVEASDDLTFTKSKRVVDQKSDLPNPGGAAWESKFAKTTARYVRLTVTKLTERNPGYFGFALSELEVLDGQKNVALGAGVMASDSVEDRTWSLARLVDGDHGSHGVEGLDALPVTMLRKEFGLERRVKRAVLYATALGVYEATINGERVGDHILAPEWTDYFSRVQYQAYDVTRLVRRGENAMGVLLGDGWYAGRIGMAQGLDPRGFPRAVYGRRAWFRGQLEIEYDDGTAARVSTDQSWTTTTSGPVRSSDIYDGEVYDFGAETPGWDKPGFSPTGWAAAIASPMTPGGHDPALVAQSNEAIRVVDRLRPKTVTEPKPGVFVFDMGQNMVGWASLRLKGRSGGEVTVRYAEMLKDDGTVYTANLRGAPQRDLIVLPRRSGKEVTWRPHFTYHGFRYVQVTGLDAAPSLGDLTGEVFCSSSPETAEFQCSDAMANKLWSNIFWTQRANLMSSPTDCPQRDERLGWMGDILAFSQNAYYNMDLAGFFTKWLQDVRDAQADDGRYPDFAPHPYGKNDRFNGVPGWGDAGVVCAWVHYMNTGDKRLLGEHFESAKKWVGWIASKNPAFLWKNERHNDYGDWLNGNTLVREGWDNHGGEVPKDVFATLMWYQSVGMVGKMAAVLGRIDDQAKCEATAARIKEAFNLAYVQPDGGITGDTQAGYALALYMGILPEGLRGAAFAKLVAAIESRNGVLTTGFHSTLPMMEVLSDMGRPDLAYKLLLNKEFPSWGYTIENGATTIWERWDGYVKGRGFQDPGMNSFNHWALGSVGEWMMERVGGIRIGPKGWHEFVIQPQPGHGVTWCKASYRSHAGLIKVSWKVEAGGLRLGFTVPANSSAVVEIPGGFKPSDAAKGRESLSFQGSGRTQRAVAPAGTYEVFVRDWKGPPTKEVAPVRATIPGP